MSAESLSPTELEELRRPHRAKRDSRAYDGWEDCLEVRERQDARKRWQLNAKRAHWRRSINRRQPRPLQSSRATAPRPRERRQRRTAATTRSPGDPSEPPLARPPLTAAERELLKAEIDRRRRAQLERWRDRDRQLFAEEARQ
jgi:hypothetical protein